MPNYWVFIDIIRGKLLTMLIRGKAGHISFCIGDIGFSVSEYLLQSLLLGAFFPSVDGLWIPCIISLLILQ